MSVARSLLRRLDSLETVVCEVLLALFVLLLFAQILARQLFGYSIAWSEELSTYMFVWFAYLGAVVAAKMSAHNRVTFHLELLPRRLAKAMRVLADLLWVAFNVYFVWLSVDFIFNRMNVFWKSQTLGVPMKVFYLILPIAFSLMTLRILWNLYLEVFKGVDLLDPEKAEIDRLRHDATGAAS
jgi:TRAP-type C4-dicarboxylate transport system permease small subunit